MGAQSTPRVDALLAMGFTADEIALAARQQEKERNAARDLAERAKARTAVIDAFNTYHKALGIEEDVPQEVWDEVFEEYEKGLIMLQDHAEEFIDALEALASILDIDLPEADTNDSDDDWIVISEDELKEELKRKVKEFCKNEYK